MRADLKSGAELPLMDFERLFKAFPDLILILLPDDDFTIAAMSDSYLRRTLLTHADAVGKSIFEVFPDDPDDPEANGVESLRASLRLVCLTQGIDSMQLQKYSVRNLKGVYERAYWSVQNVPVFNDLGEIIYILHRPQDVTEYVNFKSLTTALPMTSIAPRPLLDAAAGASAERDLETKKEAEAEVYLRAMAVQKTNDKLRSSEAALIETKERLLKQLYERTEALERTSVRTQLALDSASLGEWELDFLSGKSFRNLQHAKCFGYEDLSGEWSYDIFLSHVHADDRQDIHQKIDSSIKSGMALEFECRVVWQDGSVHWIAGRGKARYDALGNPTHLTGIVSDISRRRLREEAHIRSESNIRSLLNSTAEGIWGVDLSGRISFINEAAVRLLGYDSKDQLIGRISHDLIHHTLANRMPHALTDGPEYRAYHESLGSHRENEMLWRADGTYFLADYRATPVVENNAVIGAVISFTDNTDRLKLVAAVENERENFRMLFRETPEMVCILSGPDHVFEFVNEAHALALGFDATGMNVRTAQPESVEIHGLLDGVYDSGITAALREIPVTVGTKLRYFNLTYAPRKDPNGHVNGVMILGSEITQQVEAREAILRAKEDADAANHSKTAFIANMSHEIRTPIGVIKGFCELLQDRDLSQEERQDYLSRVVKNTKGLTRIIDDILDLAKVEAGKLEIEVMRFSLIELLQEAVELFQDRAKEKNIRLDLDLVDLSSAAIHSDPTRVRQIMINIIGNAIKFTHQGGVRVSVNSLPEESGRFKVVIRVKDTGIGLSKHQLEKIFQPFVQADGSTSRLFGGTGLGLVISRRLAFALGGSIDVEESTQGEGCTFKITLIDNFKGQAKTLKPLDEGAGPAPIETLVAPAQALRNLTILVAEDSIDNQMLVRRILTKQGATVDFANNGEEAIQKARIFPFDLILMDVQMPKVDGYEATRTLRNGGFKGPIIALTAHAMTEERERTREAGCDAHLTKPINAPLLIETIKNLAKS